jgi:hypothetical protein
VPRDLEGSKTVGGITVPLIMTGARRLRTTE